MPCSGQSCQRLARHAGLTLFGVNLTVIEPGAWSSQRHWHTLEDEFIWVVAGELTLITDSGEEVLRAGDCAAFRRGEAEGHHLVNKSIDRQRFSRSATQTPRIVARTRTLT